MKFPRVPAATASMIIVTTLLSSCSGSEPKPRKPSHTAPPGQFSTLVGIGPAGSPESDPKWFEDPTDLAMARDGKILALTKEYGRVISISSSGKQSQLFSLTQPGEALSMAMQNDGTITIIQKTGSGRLAIETAQPGSTPTKLAELPSAKNPASVHLVLSPENRVMLLEDGRLLQETKPGRFEKFSDFSGMDKKAPILAASPDGNSLILALSDQIVWTQGHRIEKRIKLKSPLYPEDGAAVAADGSGGVYVTGRSTYVSHISAQGRDGSILLGISRVAAACESGPISGPTGDAQERPLGEASALAVTPRQLYVADPICHRILAIGLPAKEYTGH